MKYYESNLKNSLHDEKQPLIDHFEYNWTDPIPSKGNLSIPYTILPTGYDLDKTGLIYTFVSEITDDDLWQCGPSVPSEELNPKYTFLYSLKSLRRNSVVFFVFYILKYN